MHWYVLIVLLILFFFYLQHLDQLVGRQTRSSTTRMSIETATTKATVTTAATVTTTATAMTATVATVPSDTVTTAAAVVMVPCDPGKLIVTSYFSEYNPYIKMHTTMNKMTIYLFFFQNTYSELLEME